MGIGDCGSAAVAGVLRWLNGVFCGVFQNATGLPGIGVGSLAMIGTGGLCFNTQQVLYIATVFLCL